MKKITLVIAPGIPETERKVLETHWKEALKDNGYSVVTNYDMHAEEIVYDDDAIVTVAAPDLPIGEVKKLRAKFDKARTKKHGLLVVNYDVRLEVLSRYQGQ